MDATALHGSRRLATLASVLALVVSWLVAAPAGAAAVPVAREYVTLRGSGTRSVLVRFDRAVDFLASGTNAEFYQPHVTTSGATVHGFAILPARTGTTGFSVFGLMLPSAQGTRPLIWPLGGSGEGFRFKPGTYRLVMLADGAGSVRFRLPGLRAGSVSFSTATPVASRVAASTMASAGVPRYSAWDTREISRTSWVILYNWSYSEAEAVSRTADCFYEGGPPPVDTPVCGGHGLAVDNYSPHTRFSTYSVGYGALSPGLYTVQTEIDNVGTLDRAGAVIYWIAT